MPLISLWKSNPDAVSELSIEQVVSAAGDGSLKDGSICSEELRTFLTEVPTGSLAEYIEYCLSTAYKQGGLVLQDLVNEVGRRLEYEVSNGRYQGTQNAIGYDGIWRSTEGNDLVVEVKTTDAYRMSLDVIAGYRRKLIDSGQLSSFSSILIIVGRDDTGELEAQIRGSRHAWDIRLISAEAILKLLQVKENSNDDAQTGAKIRSLFAPVEYTRLDRLVEVVFTAATDVEVVPEEVQSSATNLPSSVGKSSFEFTDSALLQAKRLSIIASLATQRQTHLLQKSRAQYWNPDHTIRAVCSLSKRYGGKGQHPYWYAYHPQWDEFLAEAVQGFFVIGCMDLGQAFAVPRAVMQSILPKLNQTVRETGAYWHIHLTETADGLAIVLPNTNQPFSLSPYAFQI